MSEVDECNNFGFNNPNFVGRSIELLNLVDITPNDSSAGSRSPGTVVKECDSKENLLLDDREKTEKQNDIIDDNNFFKRNVSGSQLLNNVKSRSTYAKLGAADMGVPHSPTYDVDEIDVDRLKNTKKEDIIVETVDLGRSSSSVVNVNDSSPSTLLLLDDDEDVELFSEESKFIVEEKGIEVYEADNFYFNHSARSPPIIINEGEITNGNFLFEKKSTMAMQNGHHQQNGYFDGGAGGGYFVDQQDGVVDESPQDFRRNLAMIDQVARQGGAFYPGGGIQMRREGDTTIVTEHRDPYSFYWQLDKIKKREEPPPRREEISDNVIEEVVAEETTQIQSPDSHDSGIQVEYSRPSKPVKKLSERFSVTPPARDESPQRKLPPGWEKHEDPKGFSYYWHVDSGTVQRERPTEPKASIDRVIQSEPPRQMIDRGVNAQPPATIPAAPPQQPVIVERAFKQTTTKRRVENESADDRETSAIVTSSTTSEIDGAMKLPVRFAVRSLGWTEIAEEDLTQERSSRAVNKAIVDLSTGRNDLIDNVAKWGDGKELIMELDDHDLRLIDPDSGTTLHTQPIHQIRVWGVGRDNGRDFAYVARDRNTRRFMCHVFRCDTPARTIANTLRDICKRIMLERRPNSLQTTTTNVGGDNNRKSYANHHQQHQQHPHHHHYNQQHSSNSSSHYGSGDLPHSSSVGSSSHSFSRDSFPTPMEEPKKVIRCHFLGVTQVPKATGIDILNEAVDRLVAQVRAERWILCDVSIAPSTISITEVSGSQIAECRVRYLSFLGIGRDIKHCAFIMQTSSDSFMCYVFHVEPSAGAMAKTIEAACKLRYQKVLDAHGERRSSSSTRGWGDTIRDVFGTFTGRRSGRNLSQYPR